MTTLDLADSLSAIESGRRAGELESQTLEFKQDKARPEDTERDIAEAAIGLANGTGGTIVLGIADREAGPAAFRGTALDGEHLRQSIYAATKPNLLVSVQEITHLGVRLLAVSVPEGLDVYADSKGRPYRRLGNQCQPMSPAEASSLRDDRLGTDWSAGRSERRAEEVSPLSFATLRTVLAGLPDERRALAGRSDLDLLRLLGLLDGGVLNRAGEVLLLAAPPARPRQTPVRPGNPGRAGPNPGAGGYASCVPAAAAKERRKWPYRSRPVR